VTKFGLGKKLRFRLLMHTQRLNVWPMRWRSQMFRWLGCKVSRETVIAGDVFIEGTGLVTEGLVIINFGVFLDAVAEIRFGPGSGAGHRALFITATHDIGDERSRAGGNRHAPIEVGAGSWVGGGAIIMPGVKIAPGCIIAAGAVVHRDTEPNCVYAGNPARLVRKIEGPRAFDPDRRRHGKKLTPPPSSTQQ